MHSAGCECVCECEWLCQRFSHDERGWVYTERWKREKKEKIARHRYESRLCISHSLHIWKRALAHIAADTTMWVSVCVCARDACSEKLGTQSKQRRCGSSERRNARASTLSTRCDCYWIFIFFFLASSLVSRVLGYLWLLLIRVCFNKNKNKNALLVRSFGHSCPNVNIPTNTQVFA